jgi:hypothetical protein
MRILSGAVTVVVAAAAALVVAASLAGAATVTRYVFTAFTNSSESNMNVYTSTDATNFTVLKSAAYTPPSGLVRDPSILHAADGRYYIAYTNNWTGSSFGIARSVDLVNWTYVTTVNVGVSGTQETWAPEWFVDPADGSINIIVSLSPSPIADDNNFRPYRLRALNTSFTSFGAATALSGIGPNYIDTFIVRSGSTYHAFSKNETTKYIEHSTASSLGGPYTFVGTGNWAGWGSTLEGPAVTQLDNGSWRIYMDNYSGHRYYYAGSTNLNSWGAKVELSGGLSGVVRHGTVLHDTITTTANRALRGTASGRCLTAPASNGAQSTIQDCAGSTTQLWSYTASGQLSIGSRCLDAYGQGTANGTVVDVWTCNSGANQRWSQNADGSFTGVQSGRCVDVASAATGNGSGVQLYDCNGATNQKWSWQ